MSASRARCAMQATRHRSRVDGLARLACAGGLVAVLGGLLTACADERTGVPTDVGAVSDPTLSETIAPLSAFGDPIAVAHGPGDETLASISPVAGRGPHRTATDVVPFGVADIVNGPAGMRLRVPLSSHDAAGPLHGVAQTTVVGSSKIYDLCDDAQAFESMTGQVFRQGDLFPQNSYAQLEFDRLRMGCGAEQVDAARAKPRWALRTNDRGGAIRFLTQEEALKYRDEQLVAHRQRFRNTIDAYPYGINPNGTTSLSHIEFADAEAPIDEVRIVPGTVTERQGTLRGLMRNWSRRLWAYGATVHVGSVSWTWPLSMQPGELAPFEIAVGGSYPDVADVPILVTAELVAEADLSRNWGISGTNGSLHGNAHSADLQGVVPESVLGTLPQQGHHLLVPSFAGWGGAQSHRSIPGSDTGYVPGIDDLRAYAAFIEKPRVDQLGRPVLNEGQHVAAVIDVKRLIIYGALADGGSAEIDRYPLARIRPDWLGNRLWTLFAVPEPERMDWLMWIGAAHPAS